MRANKGTFAKCSVPECEQQRLYASAKYCCAHYERYKKYGDPLIRKHASPGSGCIDDHGYRKYRINKRTVREHRLVMERVLGRPLRDGEQVHHKDGNKLNNDPSNLQLTTLRDHPKEHASFRDEKLKECSVCHKILVRDLFRRSHKAHSGNSIDPHRSQCKRCEALAERRTRQARNPNYKPRPNSQLWRDPEEA